MENSHNLSNLIGSDDNSASTCAGKLNATFAYCMWENVKERCPRSRYGKIHVLNCYYKDILNNGAFAGFMSNMRVEECYFESSVLNCIGLMTPRGASGVHAIKCYMKDAIKDSSIYEGDEYKTVFTPPYSGYTVYPAIEVKNIVTNNVGAILPNPTDFGNVPVISTDLPQNMNTISSVPVIITDKIVVNLNLKQGERYSLTLTDLNGRQIIEQSSISQENGSAAVTLNMQKVNAGAYVFKLMSTSHTLSQRIVKK